MRFNNSSAATLVLIAFAAASLFLLLVEHHAHGLGWWLMLLVPVCLVLLYVGSAQAESELEPTGPADQPKSSDRKECGHEHRRGTRAS
jgi:hypothetical protein